MYVVLATIAAATLGTACVAEVPEVAEELAEEIGTEQQELSFGLREVAITGAMAYASCAEGDYDLLIQRDRNAIDMVAQVRHFRSYVKEVQGVAQEDAAGRNLYVQYTASSGDHDFAEITGDDLSVVAHRISSVDYDKTSFGRGRITLQGPIVGNAPMPDGSPCTNGVLTVRLATGGLPL